MIRKLAAECVGTFWLVFGGCGSALIAAGFPDVGHRASGRVARLRPDRADDGLRGWGRSRAGTSTRPCRSALSCGGRLSGEASCCPTGWRRCVGAIDRGAALYVIVSGQAGWTGPGGFASNGYGAASPGGLFADLGLPDRGDPDGGLPCRDPRGHGAGAVRGRRADRDRAGAHAHSPCLDPGDEHLGQSGAVDGRGAVRRRAGAGAVVAVLGGAAAWRRRSARSCGTCLAPTSRSR